VLFRRPDDPPEAEGAFIQFETVGLRYGLGPEVLHDISFSLEPGEFRYIVGPSGAGKTSLLRLLYLAHRPTRGLIRMFGHDIATASRVDLAGLRRRIGVVFQDFRLLDHLTAHENVALPLRITGVNETEVREHVTELLTWVGLADHMHARPATLSGGQKQRVAIARALITRPDLLVADEPTGNLDETLGLRLMYLFEELNRIGTTVLIATHNEALLTHNPHPVMRLSAGTLDVAEALAA
jgi:cell division transport system ATP-binding protein